MKSYRSLSGLALGLLMFSPVSAQEESTVTTPASTLSCRGVRDGIGRR